MYKENKGHFFTMVENLYCMLRIPYWFAMFTFDL